MNELPSSRTSDVVVQSRHSHCLKVVEHECSHARFAWLAAINEWQSESSFAIHDTLLKLRQGHACFCKNYMATATLPIIQLELNIAIEIAICEVLE